MRVFKIDAKPEEWFKHNAPFNVEIKEVSESEARDAHKKDSKHVKKANDRARSKK